MDDATRQKAAYRLPISRSLRPWSNGTTRGLQPRDASSSLAGRSVPPPASEVLPAARSLRTAEAVVRPHAEALRIPSRYHVTMSTIRAWLERRKWQHPGDEPEKLTTPASDQEPAPKMSAFLPPSGSTR